MQHGTGRIYTSMLSRWQGSALGVLVAAAVLAGPAMASSLDVETTPDQCEARFNPSVLETGTIHEEVEVTLSQPIGDVQEVETPDDSGITVLWTHADEDEPLNARVRVSTVGADAGTWSVIFWAGGEETCRGEITLVEGN